MEIGEFIQKWTAANFDYDCKLTFNGLGCLIQLSRHNMPDEILYMKSDWSNNTYPQEVVTDVDSKLEEVLRKGH